MDAQRTSKLPPDLATAEKDLEARVQRSKELQRKKEENDAWIDEAYDINYLEFLKMNYQIVWWFHIVMDNSDWDLLVSALGLNTDEIQWCRKYHKEGPTREAFYMLNSKGKLKTLTLGDVLGELRKLNKKAILFHAHWQEGIETFRRMKVKDNVSNNYTILSPTVTPESFSLRIHQAPEVLMASSDKGEVNANQMECSVKKPTKSKFGAKIIVLFASDVREEALKAARLFKTGIGKGREIGVLILTPACTVAVAEALLHDPGNSIHKWFKEVDFVVPVLSPKFLLQIQDRDPDPDTLVERQYNRYLYRLMLDDYVSNMSKNCKCRALYAHEYCAEVRNSELVKGNGLFQMNWDCSSEEQLKELSEILISGAQERRKMVRQRV